MATQILRPKDVAKKLSISLATLWRMTHSEDFPPSIRISKKAVGWRESELDEYLSRRTAVKPVNATVATGNKRGVFR